jgi:hypothetical protein
LLLLGGIFALSTGCLFCASRPTRHISHRVWDIYLQPLDFIVQQGSIEYFFNTKGVEHGPKDAPLEGGKVESRPGSPGKWGSVCIPVHSVAS